MSIKTTYSLNKNTAKLVIASKLFTCSNEELENILECFKESEYRNYVIDETFNSNFVINSVEDFNETY